MTEQGYVTLPRAPHYHTPAVTQYQHVPSPTTGPLYSGQVSNGHASACVHKHSGNGGAGAGSKAQSTVSSGGRAVHDGFATIRTGSSKRGRARSSPSVVAEPRGSCQNGCCSPGGPTWAMEPLWEEKGGVEGSGTLTVAKRERPQLPWWEVATRRSRYRSCPAFSQATMVTALEQTVNNVTDKLEKLASSPDLKAIEAAELRKTAAALRQQSSAVCLSVSSGYFSMERQLSCDSVSSVTSTISAASMSSFASLGNRKLSAGHIQAFPHRPSLVHTQPESLNAEQSKIKKRSWLRSSFRRAFGRHGRKRSKQGDDKVDGPPQELPVHHAVNIAVHNLSPPPPSYEAATAHSTHNGTLQKQHKGKQQIESAIETEIVSQLRQELAEKERALTDCRLEVLSAQHQLQSQTDTVTKLQTEVTTLREENNRLSALVRSQYGPAADALITPLSNTLTGLTLSRNSITTGSSISPREDGRRVKVMVVEHPGLLSLQDVAKVIVGATRLTHIGTVTIESKTTWEELDSMVAVNLKDYGNRIDPVSALGLDGDSVLCYRIDDVVGAPSLSRPELLPYGYCVGDVDSIHVWLKGGSQRQDGELLGNVSAAAFSCVTPASSLKQLAGMLVEHRRLVLAGPPSSGKTHLANALAQFFVINSGRELTDDAIKTFTVNGTNSLEMCQMLSSMWPRGMTASGRSTSSLTRHSSISSCSSTSSTSNIESSPNLPAVIIIDDLHAAGGVVETLQRCLPASVHTGPAIISTSCPTTSLATRLHIHCNFRIQASDLLSSGSSFTARLPIQRQFVPPSSIQQGSRMESIYATPQLSTHGAIVHASAHGTEHAGLAVTKKNVVSKSQVILPQVTESNVETKSDRGIIIYASSRARSSSNASSCKLETFSRRSSDSIDGLSMKSGSVSDMPVLSTELSNGSVYPSLAVHPRIKYNRNSCEFTDGAETDSTPDSTSDEAMDSDSNSSVKDAEIYKFKTSMDQLLTSKQPMHQNMDNIDDIDTDNKPPLKNNMPQSLDVLAKNAINTCGLSPDCVKIIKERGSKIDIKGIAKELTTTFKPVETAM